MSDCDPERAESAEPRPATPRGRTIATQDRDVIDIVRRALEQRDAVLAFQPVVEAARPTRTAFYEGFIRIPDGKGRTIAAQDFITPLETTELGREIDCVALELGLQTLARHNSLRLAMNVSARSIGHPAWMKTLNRGLAHDDTIAERLILEITESSAVHMPEIVSVFMREQQARGISFALDDFGAGYTSFRYLRELCFDIIKIDARFVRGIADNPDNQVLVEALLSVARHFDMLTVAEAVETARDADYLARLGIDCLQGYYFGAPTLMPPWWTAASAPRRLGFPVMPPLAAGSSRAT